MTFRPRRIAVWLTVLVLSLLLLEGVSRLVFSPYADDGRYLGLFMHRVLNSGVAVDPGSDRYSERFGFRFSPNATRSFVTDEFRYTVHTNAQGFRSREFVPRGPAEYRLIILGDSMMWGIGAADDQTFDASLERLAAASPGGLALRAFNLSTAGYNTVQELIVAKTFVPELRPDHVVLGFCLANDILPNWIAAEDPRGRYAVSPDRTAALEQDVRSGLSCLWPSVFLRVPALLVYAPRLRYRLASRDEVLARTLGLLQELDDYCAKRGTRLTVMILYPRDTVAGDLTQFWSGSRALGERITAFCRRQGIETLDGLDVMRGSEDRSRYFFKKDGHLTPAGNAALASALYGRLLAPRIHLPKQRAQTPPAS